MTAAPGAPPATGEVFDLGYQRYEGERRGRWHSRVAIWRDGVRITLGLGRSTAQKLLPMGLIALMWLPAVIVLVVVGFVSTFGGETEEFGGPSFSEYYDFAFTFIILFTAIVAPELLCPDRRQGVLSLYLVRPIAVVDYLAARWLAFLTLTLGVLWFPQVLIFTWQALTASDPLDWTLDHWDVVPRFLAVGAVYAVVLSTLAMAAASFTERRATAAVISLAVLFLGIAVAHIQMGVAPGFAGDWLALVGLLGLTQEVGHWIFGEPVGFVPQWWNGWIALGWLALVSAGGWLLMWWRYRGLTR